MAFILAKLMEQEKYMIISGLIIRKQGDIQFPMKYNLSEQTQSSLANRIFYSIRSITITN